MAFQEFFERALRPFESVVGELPFDILVISVVAIVTWLLSRLITKLIRRGLSESPVGQVSLFVNIARVLVALYAIYFIGENVFQIKMSGVVQALGITSLVVSLGMQDLIKNVVAGMQVVTTGLLSVGDQIDVGERRGEVVDINWRQTTIRDKDGNLHLIPNSELMGSAFMRREGKMLQRHDVELDIKPGLDLNRVAVDICQLADAALDEQGLRGEEPSEVRFLGSTANGVRASVRLYPLDLACATPAMDAMMRAIGQRGYLADWTNDNPAQKQWR